MNFTGKELWFLIWGFLSICVFVAGLAYCIKVRKTIKQKLGVGSWQFSTAIIFVSALLMHIPVYYTEANTGFEQNILFPFIKAVFQSIRLFIIDADLNEVISSLNSLRPSLRFGFSCYEIALFCLAPFLTATFLLVVFKDFISRVTVSLKRNQKIYVMSELNEMSIALAESIKNTLTGKYTIVFLDVGRAEKDSKSDLLQKATELKAFCLKQDLTDANLFSNTNSYEIFFISENETENLEKVIAFSELYRTKITAKIFVYAASATSGYIIDSLDTDTVEIADDVLRGKIENNDDQVFNYIYEHGVDSSLIAKNTFDIRRIDYAEDFAVKALNDSDIFTICKSQHNLEKTISIMIVGLGKFGKEILKTALWYCQVPGYKLEINVIDFGLDKHGFKTNVKDMFEHECPEILSHNMPDYTGDEGYDVQFFDADCFSSSFDRVFEEQKARFLKTQVVFVTLGNDDKNIDIAIELRRQFDRLLGWDDNDKTLKESIKVSKYNDIPLINAVVFDDKKAKNIETKLVNHKELPYNINSIGSLSEIYSYANIIEAEKNEIDAIRYHIEWICVDSRIRDALKVCPDKKIIEEICKCRKVSSPDEIYWCDQSDDPLKKFNEQLSNYYKYEYFKNSSVSKAIHKKMLEKEFFEETSCKTGGNYFFCMCDGCKMRRKIEHMRWAAYMRVNGFRYSEKRCDRGKLHHDLVETEKLNFETQLKD